MPVSNLDEPCAACRRPAGDHTLREWAACLGTTTVDQPFRHPGAREAEQIGREIKRRFELDDDLVIADHVEVTAATLEGYSGIVKTKTPVVVHDFGIGHPGGHTIVARVAFVSEPEAMRAYAEMMWKNATAAAERAG